MSALTKLCTGYPNNTHLEMDKEVCKQFIASDESPIVNRSAQTHFDAHAS